MSEPTQLADLGIDHPVVLILVGLIASGKSTFAEALQLHFPQFRRCNQDELGDRRRVEAAARHSLQQGLSVCIDRTNADASQRAHWIDIAREFPGTPIWVLFFDTPYYICAERLQQRSNHPTIPDATTGLRVLARFAGTFAPPAPWEGHARLLRLAPADHPAAEYTREDVLAVLHRLRDGAPIESPAQPRIPHYFRRGGKGGGYRGRRGAVPLPSCVRGRGGTVPLPSRARGRGTQMQQGSLRGGTAARSRGVGGGNGHDPYRGGSRGRGNPSDDAPWRGSGSAGDPVVFD